MLPARYESLPENPQFGGFGAIEVVHDTFLDRRVIFKSMQSLADNDQLLNEVRHLSSARSRHVVEIYDVVFNEYGVAEGIIIEQLTGRDYGSFHLEAPGNIYGYIKTLYQIATALADLHEKGIVHRDLKLDNFRDSAAGILKLFDFGISTDDPGYYTINSRATLVYAAPEFWGADVKITSAMDVYALGVCAWALAKDKFPPELQQRPPQSLSSVSSIQAALPELPVEIASMVDSCLSVDPSRRPSARLISELCARYLVKNQHRGLFVVGQKSIYELTHQNRNVSVSLGYLGGVRVDYDGLDFEVKSVTGDVYINNKPLLPGSKLSEACVLTFGKPELRYNREWVNFSSSRPEVVL
ncbi:protein kinase family protein [Pseudomonas sp. GM78]|uniref:protein kinase domain-containing protein n=1 Tax=Pseudomonas sp. GM78 TaxID=1144337 RepID=UPI00026F6B7E|nr:protein kinase [Pseudomonas sp. GM78]EJN32240.1 protein kinase family protein [Pseudomonas sp. GM78]